MQRNTDLSLGLRQNSASGDSNSFFDLLHAEEKKDEKDQPSYLEKHLSFIQTMAQLTSSGITVFDLQKNIHVYTSRNFYHLFGYNIEDNQDPPQNDVFDRKVHPEDLIELKNNGYAAIQFLSTIPASLRRQYKMINQYRIQKIDASYVMVTEQHQILEQDPQGNTRFSLGVIDISANQEMDNGVNFQIHNCQTGEFIFLHRREPMKLIRLTVREQEILKLINEGKISKEIAGQLAISVHTVNTHRQRILEKLEVDNSIEAIRSAKRYGLLK